MDKRKSKNRSFVNKNPRAWGTAELSWYKPIKYLHVSVVFCINKEDTLCDSKAIEFEKTTKIAMYIPK